MPIFEYVCKECGHRFEKLVNGVGVSECPSCMAAGLEKQLSAFAVGSTGLPSPGPCGTCGDPQGPGACSLTL